MSLLGPHDVIKMEGHRDVEGLIKALNYRKDKDIRCVAASALAEIGGERAVEPLVQALKDEEEFVRTAIVDALGRIGDKRAVEPLVQALKDESEYVRCAAAKALGEIGDSRAVEPLIPLLKDDSMFVDTSAALGKIGDSQAVEPLISYLEDENRYVRQQVVETLGQIGDSQAVEPLIAHLLDKDHYVRRHSAEALENLYWQPDTVEDRVLYLIGSSEWDKCVEIGTPAIEPLIALLRDADEYGCSGAIETLGQIGGSQVVEPLIAVLEDDGNMYNDYHRETAAKALGPIGDNRAIEPLIRALKNDEDDSVRLAAAEALDKLGWQPDTNENRVLMWVEKKEWNKCVEMGTPAVEQLMAVVKNEDDKYYPYDRSDAAEALGQIGDKRAFEPLVQALMDENEFVRLGAVEALGRIGDKRAVKQLIPLLKDEVEWVRDAAAKALESLQ